MSCNPKKYPTFEHLCLSVALMRYAEPCCHWICPVLGIEHYFNSQISLREACVCHPSRLCTHPFPVLMRIYIGYCSFDPSSLRLCICTPDNSRWLTPWECLLELCSTLHLRPCVVTLLPAMMQALEDLFQTLETNSQQLQALGNVNRASVVPLNSDVRLSR